MHRWALLVMVFVVGCDPLAPRTNVVNTRYYSIAPMISVNTYPTLPLALGVRQLDYARVYKERIVYRESPHEVKIYEHDEWTELPRDAVTRAVQDALAQTQRFRDVGDALDMRTPDLTLTGELRAFEEVRTEDPPYAYVEIRLSLRRTLGLRDHRALWSDVLSASVPLARDEVAGVAEAMSQAVAQVAADAATAMAELDIEE
jgi:ABC-type uncharacterized transport system auxiliary subunit